MPRRKAVTRKAVIAAGLLLLLFPIAGIAQAVTSATTQFNITVQVTPLVTGLTLSSSSVTTAGANNAGAIVGNLSLTTNPPGGSFTGTVAITSGTKFVLANPTAPCTIAGGIVTCANAPVSSPIAQLVVGSANVDAGQYPIAITAAF